MSLLDAFSVLDTSLDTAHLHVNNITDGLSDRMAFHLDFGLERVKYALEHGFERGWDDFKERVFTAVCLDFEGVASTVNRSLYSLREMKSRDTKHLIYRQVHDMLGGRQELVLRAERYVTRTRDAFLTGNQLLPFKVTGSGYYDLAYISTQILLDAYEEDGEKYYSSFKQGIHELNTAIGFLMNVTNEAYAGNGIMNETLFSLGNTSFISGCLTLQKEIFNLEEKVIEKPIDDMEDIIEDFEREMRTFKKAYDGTITKIKELKYIVSAKRHTQIDVVLHISRRASEYLENPNALKTPLSEAAITMEKVKGSLRSLFGELRSDIRGLDESFKKLQSACRDVWRVMKEEVATERIYERLYKDAMIFLDDTSQNDVLIQRFADLLEISSTELNDHTPTEVVRKINGDLFNLSINNVEADIDYEFDKFDELDIMGTFGDKDERLLEAFEDLRESLRAFMMGNQVDSSFYK